jgi:hypothetical protein
MFSLVVGILWIDRHKDTPQPKLPKQSCVEYLVCIETSIDRAACRLVLCMIFMIQTIYPTLMLK